MSNLVKQDNPVKKIKLWSQRDNSSVNIETQATTWGELKKDVGSEVNFKNIKGIVRETKHVLELDDAKLPQGEFTIFLLPTKVRSGMGKESGIIRTKAEYEKDFNSKELRKLCVERGLGSDGNKADHAKRLANDDLKKSSESHKVNKDLIKAPLTSKKSEEIARIEPASPAIPAIIERGTITTEMTLRITDVDALGSLLAVQFPGAEVVEVDAVISLKATLAIGPAPIVEKPSAPEAPKEKPVKEKPSFQGKSKSEPSKAKNSDIVEAEVQAEEEVIHEAPASDDELAKEAAALKGLI